MKFLAPLFLLSLAFSTSCATTFETAMRTQTHFEWVYEPTVGEERTALYEEVRERIRGWGYTVDEFGDDCILAECQGFGYTYVGAKLMGIRGSMPGNAKFETIVHEAAHIFQPSVWSQPEQKSESEVWAELVTQGVMRHYGYEGYEEISNKYLLGYKSGADVAKWFEKDIAVTVKFITGELTPQFTK
jgi:hypothetical protein